MSAFMAFLHHLAAFAVVVAIAVEFVFIRDDPFRPDCARLDLPDAEVPRLAQERAGPGDRAGHPAHPAPRAHRRGDHPARPALMAKGIG
jgi:hypothetical protein